MQQDHHCDQLLESVQKHSKLPTNDLDILLLSFLEQFALKDVNHQVDDDTMIIILQQFLNPSLPLPLQKWKSPFHQLSTKRR